MQSFKDITVVPLLHPKTGSVQPSGPIWPDWAQEISARHCRNGAPIDDLPVLNGDIETNIDAPMIWAGTAHRHFGHFIAEHAPRLLHSVQNSGKEKFLFGCSHTAFAKRPLFRKTPPHFKFITRWFGLKPSRIVFCNKNMNVSRLSVAPQAEQIYNGTDLRIWPTVSETYLDMLDHNTYHNKLPVFNNDIVFVSRAKLPFPKMDFVGSTFLDAVLQAHGVTVFHPELHSLQDQLSIYAGAKQLIFSEGSAIHTLQLMGHNNCAVSIMNRRPFGELAKNSLLPRCKSLNYYNTSLAVLNADGHFPIVQKAFPITILDTNALFECFSNAGVDLSKDWDETAYRAALGLDLRAWIQNIRLFSLRRWNSFGDQSKLFEMLEKHGFEDVARFAKTHLPRP